MKAGGPQPRMVVDHRALPVLQPTKFFRGAGGTQHPAGLPMLSHPDPWRVP